MNVDAEKSNGFVHEEQLWNAWLPLIETMPENGLSRDRATTFVSAEQLWNV